VLKMFSADAEFLKPKTLALPSPVAWEDFLPPRVVHVSKAPAPRAKKRARLSPDEGPEGGSNSEPPGTVAPEPAESEPVRLEAAPKGEAKPKAKAKAKTKAGAVPEPADPVRLEAAPKGEAKPKAKAKAKAKAGAKSKAAPTAKAGTTKEVATAKRKAAVLKARAEGVQMEGCTKCRWRGCAQCRRR
jgi:hypothetical protein